MAPSSTTAFFAFGLPTMAFLSTFKEASRSAAEGRSSAAGVPAGEAVILSNEYDPEGGG